MKPQCPCAEKSGWIPKGHLPGNGIVKPRSLRRLLGVMGIASAGFEAGAPTNFCTEWGQLCRDGGYEPQPPQSL